MKLNRLFVRFVLRCRSTNRKYPSISRANIILFDLHDLNYPSIHCTNYVIIIYINTLCQTLWQNARQIWHLVGKRPMLDRYSRLSKRKYCNQQFQAIHNRLSCIIFTRLVVSGKGWAFISSRDWLQNKLRVRLFVYLLYVPEVQSST
jgi:hypothetical protein